MNTLVILTLVWTAVLVLALLYFLIPTALNLSSARRSLRGIAAELEQAAKSCIPVNSKLAVVHAEAGAVVGCLVRVRDALGSVLSALGAPVA